MLHAEIVEAPPYFTPGQLGALEQQRLDTRANTEARLIRFGRRHTRYPFSTLIVDNPPAAAILHEAKQGDLIVMGTNGHRGARHWLVGSVGDRVLRDATLPVLFVPAATEGVLP
jgi:nucleotide-binding universal stress UspA family protein